MEHNLIKKIKQLKKIQPSPEWLDSTRHNLVSQIDFEAEKVKTNFGFFNWLKHPQSLALAICLLLIFIGGPWLMVMASQASLPGELLYSVKRMGEGVQATVASESSKTQLQVEFAGKRLEELTKITEDSFAPEEKTEKVKQVVNDLKDNLAGATTYLDKISKENVIVVAKKAMKIREDLTKTKEEMPLEAQTDLAEAEKAIEEISHQILTILVKDRQETAEGTTTTTPDEEILIFLEELESGMITTTEEIINQIK
jgi:predicted DNA-binding protein (UPF0278 family)